MPLGVCGVHEEASPLRHAQVRRMRDVISRVVHDFRREFEQQGLPRRVSFMFCQDAKMRTAERSRAT